MKKYLIALDQGTTSSRAIIFDQEQNIVDIAQKEFRQIFPRAGWVEHDPLELYSSQYAVLMEALARSYIRSDEVAAIGIANQRETTIVWDKITGQPVYNAIVWQCRRTAPLCEKLKADPEKSAYIRKATGLLVDAYFSATKIAWILDNVPGARRKAEEGRLLFGTVDSWLLWKLTGGRVHATDYTNASRTMLFNIETLRWDETICGWLGIPLSMLPQVRSSSEVYGTLSLSGHEIPLASAVGDQQAALFGQGCFQAGEAKNTYGTGCFLLMNTGERLCRSSQGLLSTIAIGLGGKVQYALEGRIFTVGSVVQWLRDEMRFFGESRDSEYFAAKVPDNGGVYLVPAFTGLGAPHWDMYARGTIVGLTRGTGRDHIIRAALESIAYQTQDVLEAMAADTSIQLDHLQVDGGASSNAFLMQFQADIIGKAVVRPMIKETTALGAACLAGLAVGFWKDQKELNNRRVVDTVYRPAMPQERRDKLLSQWHRAVQRARQWAEEEE